MRKRLFVGAALAIGSLGVLSSTVSSPAAIAADDAAATVVQYDAEEAGSEEEVMAPRWQNFVAAVDAFVRAIGGYPLT